MLWPCISIFSFSIRGNNKINFTSTFTVGKIQIALIFLGQPTGEVSVNLTFAVYYSGNLHRSHSAFPLLPSKKPVNNFKQSQCFVNGINSLDSTINIEKITN